MIKRKCSFCPKVIEGYNNNQVDHMMKQHIISAHPTEVKFSNREEQEAADEQPNAAEAGEHK